MQRPCCADVSHKKFMHVGVHKLFLSACGRNVDATSKKKVYALRFNGPLSSRCWVPGAPCPGLGCGRFELVWAVICWQYLVCRPCLAMGAQIKADACWLLISRSCFTLIFCSKLVWVSGSEPFRPWVHRKSLCWKSLCMFFRPYMHMPLLG